MENANEESVGDVANVTAAEDTPMGYRGGVRPSAEHTASDGASGAVGFLERLRRFGAGARALIREVCTFELLGLCTMLLPALMAGVGFFFGRTVTPLYFYVSVAILLVCAFVGGWKRGLAYVALLAVCIVLTMFTFSYTGTDAQAYHFPAQYLLHHGWNPVFDSTLEKFAAVAGDAQLVVRHALFMPRFGALCGAIVASAFHLFSGDAFLGYVLIVCLFATSLKFAERYWNAGVWMGILFACGLTFSTKVTSFLAGQVDYSTYAAFCISALSLVLYVRSRKPSDLLTFAASTSICVSAKSNGILCSGVLVLMTLPLLFRRPAYWRTLFWTGACVMIVGASPFLTSWIHYGSPIYPFMTFDPKVTAFDITGKDFSFNADALSMGYFSRMCYAWISPKLTIAAMRLVNGDSGFNPIFAIVGGVAGQGLWFNALLAMSVVLLVVSRKNLVTWLCVVIFVSSNFAPLKFIGYARYFPQIWAIFPLAVLNFACTTRDASNGRLRQCARRVVVVVLALVLAGLSGLSLLRTAAYQGRMLVQERFRQDLIASFPQGRPVKVNARDYRFTTLRRFEQAGRTLVKSDDGEVDTEMQPDSALPCFDTHPEVYADLNARFPFCDGVKTLLFRFRWLDVFRNLPHVLWDSGQGGAK